MFYYHHKQTWEVIWRNFFYCQINSPYTQLATACTGDVTFLKTIIFLTIKEIFTKCSQFLHEKLSCRSRCRARWSGSVQKVFRLTSFRKNCDMISVVTMPRIPLHRLIEPFQVRHFSIREGTFYLGGGGLGPQRRGSSVKVSTKRGGPYLMWAIQGRVTHLFQNFLMRIFVMLLSIFLTD